VTPAAGRVRLSVLRAGLAIGIASGLGGLTQVRFELYDRVRRARPEEYWHPGVELMVAGAMLAGAAFLLHRHSSSRPRAPLLPRRAGPPLALGAAGLALVLICGLDHRHDGRVHPLLGDDPRELVLDTVALYLLAASLGWSLLLPHGRLAYSTCLFLAVAIASVGGAIARVMSGLPAIFLSWFPVLILWCLAARSLLAPRCPERPWDAEPLRSRPDLPP